MNILLIEDNYIWQLSLERMLATLGWDDFYVANDIDVAKKYLQTTKPDLIISDIVLEDGLSFELFEGNAYLDIPIVFLTSFAEGNYYQAAMKNHNSAFLVKPFHAFSLKSIVDTLLKNKEKTTIDAPTKGIQVKGKYNQPITLALGDIFWLKTEGNYCYIHTAKSKYILVSSFNALRPILDNTFCQVHRSFIINTDYIQRIDVLNNRVILKDEALEISKRFKKGLLQLMANKKI